MHPPTAPSANQSAPVFHLAYVTAISAIAALGGLLFGYDWVVIGGAKPFFERYFSITSPALSGWANSCALVGCLAGVLTAGALGARLGRKRLLAAAALLFAATSIGNALAPTFALFIAWRILGGVAIGMASNLSPLYIAEIAPARWRGRLVAVNQLTIVSGILLAQFVNWRLARDLPAGADGAWIAASWFGQNGWRWMLGLTAIPATLFALGMLFVPESPRWLVAAGRPAAAGHVFQKIGGPAYARAAVADTTASLASSRANDKSAWRDLFDPKLRRVLLLGIGLAVFQQWCGINVIFNYAEDIFRAAGYDISSVLKNMAWTGSVNLIFTLAALGSVDRLGRRPLMLAGAGGLAIIYAALGAGYLAGMQGWPMLLLVLAAIACYAMSLAPVTWVVISEIFPNRVRGAATAVAVAALWSACFVLTYTFPILNRLLGAHGTFWLYSAICLAGFFLVKRHLPETKNRTLEQLEKELQNNTIQ
ncbi:sugar porter family MFS transporter [Termitidicoccus mucosus]|uniref:MFS transporter n=1 Tax=Termitidicoccus mucosus TaxID=1184151 RepID=A0A178IFR8_9BACT|nr:MFS transporter [Opitutaceae bacterium TSB47]